MYLELALEWPAPRGSGQVFLCSEEPSVDVFPLVAFSSTSAAALSSACLKPDREVENQGVKMKRGGLHVHSELNWEMQVYLIWNMNWNSRTDSGNLYRIGIWVQSHWRVYMKKSARRGMNPLLRGGICGPTTRPHSGTLLFFKLKSSSNETECTKYPYW